MSGRLRATQCSTAHLQASFIALQPGTRVWPLDELERGERALPLLRQPNGRALGAWKREGA
jgi:hypothetical protein